jgi:hypothetical protein
LLDAVGRHQEVGFERLYQWTAAKCAQMDEREPSSYLHRAIALLRDRPEFYKCVRLLFLVLSSVLTLCWPTTATAKRA